MNEVKAAARAYAKGLVDTSTKLAVKPAEFFREVAEGEGFVQPLLYVVAITALSVALGAIEFAFSRGVGLHDLGNFFILLVIVPLIAAILSPFVAGICYLIWLFIGSSKDYETSFRCVSYTVISLPISILLSVIPYFGLLGIAWWFFLMVIATREAHKVSIKPALLVFGIIAALMGLVYHSAVSSGIKSREQLEAYTKELQKMPGESRAGTPGR